MQQDLETGVLWVKLDIGFLIAFFYCPRVEMSLHANRCFLGRRSVSLANCLPLSCALVRI
jgi:hypothetical protein